MFWIFLWIVLVFLVPSIVYLFSGRDALANAIGSAVFTAFVGCMLVFAGDIAGWEAQSHTYDTSTHSLKTISDGNQTSGHFFLGSGVIDQEPSFTFYQRNAGGRYVLTSVPASEASVIETDGTPRVVRYYRAHHNGLFGGRWWSFTTERASYPAKTEFYVPPGSVKDGFTLDAK